MWGEDFDYSTVDKSVGNFYHCFAAKLENEAKAEFQAKVNAECKLLTNANGKNGSSSSTQ